MQQTNFKSRIINPHNDGFKPIFSEYWPAYRHWYQTKKAADINASALRYAEKQFHHHLPEIEPIYQQLRDIANDDPVAAQFLTGFQPPPYLVNCSQAVLIGDKPLLIRNYDLSPDLSENLVSQTHWLGRKVMGSNECLWGLNDGINQSGLVASLTFGGSQEVGVGFGVPFIMRYLLQICDNVREAIDVLKRVPSHMAYNITLLDRNADFATVMIAPNKEAIVTRARCITNHQGQVTWPEQAAFSRTQARKQHLDKLLAKDGSIDQPQLLDAFLTSPLRNTNYQQQFGTVYTAIYKPKEGTLSYHWPEGKSWHHHLQQFKEREIAVNLAAQPQKPAHYQTDQVSALSTINSDIKTILLASLIYAPQQSSQQKLAYQILDQALRNEQDIDWQTYAEQVSRVWARAA